MRIRRGFPQIVVASGTSLNAAVSSYVAAAAANGGTVSSGRQSLLRTLFAVSMDTGHWWATDEIVLLTAEDAPTALTTVKQNVLMTAVASPTFTADRGYAFNGTTQYINTNIIATNGGKAASGNIRLGGYERTETASNGFMFGTASLGGGSATFRPRIAAGNVTSIIMMVNYAFAATSSLGYTVGSMSGTAQSGWKNGVAQTGATATPVTPVLDKPWFIGARNLGDNTANGFRASTVGMVDWGVPLSGTAAELAWYTALQTFMTAIGANV